MKEFKHVDYPSIHIQLINEKDASSSKMLDELLTRTSTLGKEDKLEDELVGLPSHVESSQKYLYGIFDDTNLIGCIDWIEDYPKKDIGLIRYFVLEPKFKGTDLATQLYHALEETARDTGTIMIDVDSTHTENLDKEFWKTLGFEEKEKTVFSKNI